MPVHSTDGLPSLLIPLRRAYMVAFWIVASACAAAGATLMADVAEATPAWPWSAAAAASALLSGVACPELLPLGIRAWNGLARRVAGALRSYTLRVCYYTLVLPVGVAGRGGPGTLPASEAGWLRREAEHQWEAALPRSWQQGLSAYARSRPERRWSLTLVPLVVLLTVLRDEAQDTVPPGSTYTLY